MPQTELLPFYQFQKDWDECGMEGFVVEEIDLVEKDEIQSIEAFNGDLETLLELWDEKLPKENRY